MVKKSATKGVDKRRKKLEKIIKELEEEAILNILDPLSKLSSCIHRLGGMNLPKEIKFVKRFSSYYMGEEWSYHKNYEILISNYEVILTLDDDLYSYGVYVAIYEKNSSYENEDCILYGKVTYSKDLILEIEKPKAERKEVSELGIELFEYQPKFLKNKRDFENNLIKLYKKTRTSTKRISS